MDDFLSSCSTPGANIRSAMYTLWCHVEEHGTADDRRRIIHMARLYSTKNKASFASQEEYYFRSGIDFARLIGSMSSRLRVSLDKSTAEGSAESHSTN